MPPAPDVEETLKWSSPHFRYKGGMMCGMAAFKEHAIFGFWKGSMIEGVSPNRNNGGTAMGNFGCLTLVKDLPGRKQLTALIKEAMRLNEQGIVVARPRKAPKPEAVVPPELAAALKRNKPAAAHFDRFSPSHRREYIEWVDDAKREETKAKRVAQAVEWIAEGKGRNWKYQR